MQGADASGTNVAAPRERLILTHVEGLRAVAALMVLVNHAYAQAGFPGHSASAPWYLAFFGYSMVIGHLSVSVFIVISGFCLTLPVVEGGGGLVRGVWQFLKRRARRILPPYYSAVFLCLLLIATIIGTPTGSIWDVPIRVDFKDIVAHLLLLQDLFGTGTINYVFWSIAVEWQIYFLFPVLVWVTRRYGVLFTTAASLCLGYAVLFMATGTRVERANPHFFGLFALGMLAAHVVRSPELLAFRTRTRQLWKWLALAGLVTTCALARYWGFSAPLHFPAMDLPIGIMAFALLVHTTQSDRAWATRVLNLRGLVLVGTFSYSLYLVHAPLLQIIWQYGLRPLQLPAGMVFLILCTGGAALIILCAYLFFLVCEKPFMRVQRRPAAIAEQQAANVSP